MRLAYCARVTSIDTSPLVLHGRRRSAARLRSGLLLLDGGGVHRRIPVTAIERVDVNGAGGRRLTIVLTGAEPQTFSVTSRSAPAVREFAEAVRRALPVRDAGEPRPDGAGLVTVAPLERPGLEPKRVLWWALGAVWALLALVLLVKGPADGFLCWLFSPVVVAGWMAVRGGAAIVREAWALRVRGITVEGRLERSWDHHGDNGTVTQYVYAYEDANGVSRTRSGSEGGADRVEIVYDARDPEITKVGRHTLGNLVGSLLLFVILALPLLLLGLGLLALGLLALVA